LVIGSEGGGAAIEWVVKKGSAGVGTTGFMGLFALMEKWLVYFSTGKIVSIPFNSKGENHYKAAVMGY